jgi:hypothetical protein
MDNTQLADVLKTHLDNDISTEAKSIIEDAIYRINNIGKYISKLFKRGTTLAVSACPAFTVTENNLADSFKEIREREEGKGNPEPWFDDDIYKWFKGITVPAITAEFTSTIQRFTKTVIHEQVLDEAEKLSIKKIYTLLEAKMVIHQAILKGEVDVKGTAVIAYFKVDGNDTLYRFGAYRIVDDQLSFSVFKVNLDRKYFSGDGACFSN